MAITLNVLGTDSRWYWLQQKNITWVWACHYGSVTVSYWSRYSILKGWITLQRMNHRCLCRAVAATVLAVVLVVLMCRWPSESTRVETQCISSSVRKCTMFRSGMCQGCGWERIQQRSDLTYAPCSIHLLCFSSVGDSCRAVTTKISQFFEVFYIGAATKRTTGRIKKDCLRIPCFSHHLL